MGVSYSANAGYTAYEPSPGTVFQLVAAGLCSADATLVEPDGGAFKEFTLELDNIDPNDAIYLGSASDFLADPFGGDSIPLGSSASGLSRSAACCGGYR